MKINMPIFGFQFRVSGVQISPGAPIFSEHHSFFYHLFYITLFNRGFFPIFSQIPDFYATALEASFPAIFFLRRVQMSGLVSRATHSRWPAGVWRSWALSQKFLGTHALWLIDSSFLLYATSSSNFFPIAVNTFFREEMVGLVPDLSHFWICW